MQNFSMLSKITRFVSIFAVCTILLPVTFRFTFCSQVRDFTIMLKSISQSYPTPQLLNWRIKNHADLSHSKFAILDDHSFGFNVQCTLLPRRTFDVRLPVANPTTSPRLPYRESPSASLQPSRPRSPAFPLPAKRSR